MNINQFTYNGKRSYDDMGMVITQTPPFVVAERDIAYTSLPGRSGDLIIDNGRFKNVTMTYNVALWSDFMNLPAQVRKIAAWLQNADGGYFPLSDTYDPEYFRYARYSGNISIADILLKIGTAKLSFNCKPCKYSFAGQNTVTLGASGMISNPEAFASIPYIKITGSGNITLSIGNSSFPINGVDEYIEIDSEIMAAYKATELQNEKISFTSFPTLAPGENNISTVGNVTKIEIVPRWWTI